MHADVLDNADTWVIPRTISSERLLVLKSIILEHVDNYVSKDLPVITLPLLSEPAQDTRKKKTKKYLQHQRHLQDVVSTDSDTEMNAKKNTERALSLTTLTKKKLHTPRSIRPRITKVASDDDDHMLEDENEDNISGTENEPPVHRAPKLKHVYGGQRNKGDTAHEREDVLNVSALAAEQVTRRPNAIVESDDEA